MCEATDVWSGSMTDSPLSSYSSLTSDHSQIPQSFSFRFALATPTAITEIFWVLIILHMTLWRHSVPELKGLYTHYISNRTALWVRGLPMGHSRCWRAGFLRRKMLTPSLPLAIPLSPPPSLSSYRINLKFLNLKLKVMLIWHQVTYLSRCHSLLTWGSPL